MLGHANLNSYFTDPPTEKRQIYDNTWGSADVLICHPVKKNWKKNAGHNNWAMNELFKSDGHILNLQKHYICFEDHVHKLKDLL